MLSFNPFPYHILYNIILMNNEMMSLNIQIKIFIAISFIKLYQSAPIGIYLYRHHIRHIFLQKRKKKIQAKHFIKLFIQKKNN